MYLYRDRYGKSIGNEEGFWLFSGMGSLKCTQDRSIVIGKSHSGLNAHCVHATCRLSHTKNVAADYYSCSRYA